MRNSLEAAECFKSFSYDDEDGWNFWKLENLYNLSCVSSFLVFFFFNMNSLVYRYCNMNTH